MSYEPLTATQAPSRPTATPDPTRIRMVEIYTCPSCGNATNLRHCMGTVRNPHPERPVPTQSTIAIPAADAVDALEALAAQRGRGDTGRTGRRRGAHTHGGANPPPPAHVRRGADR